MRVFRDMKIDFSFIIGIYPFSGDQSPLPRNVNSTEAIYSEETGEKVVPKHLQPTPHEIGLYNFTRKSNINNQTILILRIGKFTTIY